MPYIAFVIICLGIHILTNIDMFVKKDNIPAIKAYRAFVIAVGVYYLSDILWGIFESNKLSTALYFDTIVYFFLLGLTIFLWTDFVVRFLEGDKRFATALKVVGLLFFVGQSILLIINIFYPILFTVDEQCVYEPKPSRDVMLYIQIGMYVLTIIYSFIYTLTRKVEKFRRYIAVSLFSSVMVVCIIAQLTNSYLPLYSAGCMIGMVILDTLALSDTKERFKVAYQETKKKNIEGKAILAETKVLAYSDSLTGVKNRHAYVDVEEKFDDLIGRDSCNDFAIAVFDINGLKRVNDTEGHDAGDRFIKEAVKIIGQCFPFDTIYRFGGDEFVCVLEGENYKNRQKYMGNFVKIIDTNAEKGKITIASGISSYRKGYDNTYRSVFNRADKLMYACKEYFKEHHQ